MTVVATTDGSEESLNVLPHAARFARAIGEALVLLRVLDPLIDAKSVLAPSLREAVRRVSERWQAELQEVLATRGIEGSVHVAARIHGEEVPDTVLGAARTLEASVIATHSHGAGKLRRAFVGSTAMAVLAKADCPLLVTGPVAGPSRTEEPYHVFLTSDGSPASDAAMPRLLPLLERVRARVTLFQSTIPGTHAVGEPTDAGAARAHLEALGTRLTPGSLAGIVVAEASAPAAVAELAVQQAVAAGATAIAMSTHGHSARYQIAAGSVAVGVVSASPLPVLLVRAPRSA